MNKKSIFSGKISFKVTSALILFLCGGLIFTSCGVLINKSPSKEYLRVEADDIVEEKENFSHYYEHLQANTVAISFVNHDLSSDYVTPMDYYETTRGYSGSIKAGHLTVSGNNLEKKGYYAPSSSFDYTSYSVGSSVTLSFTFDPATTSSVLNEYAIADCHTKKVDGVELNGEMGKGAVIILKRRVGETGWKEAAKYNKVSSGTTINYTPSAADVFYGTYYRFVSAFQYYYLDHLYSYWLTDIKHYGFVDCLQRLNVFLARGAVDVKFANGYTETKTHELAKETHLVDIEEDIKKGNIVNISEENLVDTNVDSFKLVTNSIKASESSATIENNVPVFHFNGIEQEFGKSAIYETKGSVTTGSINKSFVVNTKHPNKNATSTFTSVIIGSGLTFIQGLKENESEYTWDDLGVPEEGHYNLSVAYYSQYKLFRAINIVPHSSNSKLYITMSYFTISVDPKLREKYTFLDGHESDLSSYVAATTLSDGSVCFSSFTMQRDDTNYVVEYAYNSNPYIALTDLTHTFTKAGKYRFRVSNAFEEVKYTTIYLLDVAEDNAKSAYFNHFGGFSGLFDESKRVYAPDSAIPTYGRGTNFYIDASETKPGLYGRILRVHNDGTYTELQTFEDLHTPIDGVLNTIGRYCFEINVGDPNSGGDHICYTINCSIVDETTYTPKVNEELLENSYFASSFMPNVYTVSHPSLGEGNFIFVYPGTEDGYLAAWDKAMDLEGLSIIFNDDNSYTYKGVNYTSRFALFADLKVNAKEKIVENYLDVSNALAGQDEYSDITSTSLDHDVYVVESEQMYKALTVQPVYINDYVFVSLRDYESSSVKMTNIESGEVYDIPYGVNVSTILTKSGRYLVEETNWCGTTSYEVVYILKDVNTASFVIGYFTSEGVDNAYVSQNSSTSLTSRAVYFNDIKDEIDEYELITITFEDNSKAYYTMSELKGLVIDRNGVYQITIRNRIGYSYTFSITIEGGKDDGGFLPHLDEEIAKELTL